MTATKRQALADRRWKASVDASWTALTLNLEHGHPHDVNAATFRVTCRETMRETEGR